MALFNGKVVLVTGASAGIGAGTAILFAKHKAKLVITGRNETNLKNTAKACGEQGTKSSDILMVLGDLTVEEDCNNIVDKAIEKFGRLDILVNNAGAAVTGNIEATTVKDLDFMYNILLRSVFNVTKRAVPHLKKAKGSIVNVSTVGSVISVATFTAYGTIKAALNHFSKILAQDLGPSGVRVNCILPGSIDTSMQVTCGFLKDASELYEKTAHLHALNRVGQVDEVAELIVFLSSDKASFITGGTINIDGGLAGKSLL